MTHIAFIPAIVCLLAAGTTVATAGNLPYCSPNIHWTVTPETIKTGLNPTEHISIQCRFNASASIRYIGMGKKCCSGCGHRMAHVSDKAGGVVLNDDKVTGDVVFTGDLDSKVIVMDRTDPNATDACRYSCHTKTEDGDESWSYVMVSELKTSVEEVVTGLQELEFKINGGSPIQVLLVGGATNSSGAVEVSRYVEFDDPTSVETGMLCADGFLDNDNGAEVVCHMLGYSTGTSVVGNSFLANTTDRAVMLGDVRCDGTEQRLDDCHQGGRWGDANLCSSGQLAGVSCA